MYKCDLLVGHAEKINLRATEWVLLLPNNLFIQQREQSVKSKRKSIYSAMLTV